MLITISQNCSPQLPNFPEIVIKCEKSQIIFFLNDKRLIVGHFILFLIFFFFFCLFNGTRMNQCCMGGSYFIYITDFFNPGEETNKRMPQPLPPVTSRYFINMLIYYSFYLFIFLFYLIIYLYIFLSLHLSLYLYI